MIPPKPADQPASTANLSKVHVGLREDLEVSRHVFRGVVSYVVRDQMTFQSQRLDAGDYEVFAAIRSDRSLGETFADLVRRDVLQSDEEEKFHQFVLMLHRLGFLRLPIADDKAVYRRFQARKQGEARQRLTSILFLRIPLWNPDAFLQRTMHLFRFVFSGTFFALWLVLVGFALYVGQARWESLRQPLDGVLVAQNLPLLWLTLVGLKVFHEFGHAYACKHFGGHVPEMGAYFLLFTPCAYVDATACWSFTRKRDRLIVCLAGMYIESIFAAIAVLVWAMTEPSIINSIAYNVIFLAGVVTVLFNINPLMRYDGYYILSDWLEIPNLRQRADRHIRDVVKRWLLKIRPTGEPEPRRLRAILFSYGFAAFLYRIALLISIAAVLATKVFLLGVVFAAVYLGNSLIGSLRRLTGYLWRAEETAPVRLRAAALGILLLVVLPAVFAVVPLPSTVHAAGIVSAEKESVLRASSSGFLQAVMIEPGCAVAGKAPIAKLSNDALAEAVAEQEARWRASSLRQEVYRATDPVKAIQEEAMMLVHQAALARARDELDRAVIRSPFDGRLVGGVRHTFLGRYFRKGDAIGTVVAGPCIVRAIVTEEQLQRMAVQIGDRVQFRPAANPSLPIDGRLLRVAPAGSKLVGVLPLTHVGGGDIAVDPLTHEANKPYFEIVAEMDALAGARLRHGSTGSLRLVAQREPLAQTFGRRLIRFWNQLYQ